MNDKELLKEAIEQAKESVEQGGFPAGAVVVKNREIVAKAISIGEAKENDPTGHGETTAIRQACQNLGTHDLQGATLYASLQPCIMCFSVANWASISKIVFAAKKTPEMVQKGYYEGSTDTERINQENNRKIESTHYVELEPASLEIVAQWEARNNV